MRNSWGFFLLPASLVIIPGYVVSIIRVFSGYFTFLEFLAIFGIVTVFAVLHFFYWNSDKFNDDKRKAVIPWVIFYFGGIFELSSIVVIIISIVYLIKDGSCIIPLICGVIVAIIVPIAVKACYSSYKRRDPYRHYRRLKKALLENTLVEDEDAKEENVCNEQMNSQFVFCRKCGEKIPIDSEYCTSCGTRVIAIHNK